MSGVGDPWYTHRFIYKVLNFEVEYITRSPLRVGAGITSKLVSPINSPVVRVKFNGGDKPYIPGSSIKGVFRSSTEYISRSSGLKVCSVGEGCRDKFDKNLKDMLKDNNIEGVLNLLGEYCLVCKLFGSSTYRSHIDFTDAYPFEDVTTGLKVGIAIDRRSGAVKRRGLYTVEYINPGARFRGNIILHNIPNYGVGLIYLVIKGFKTGIFKIGGMRTRGFGKIDINILKLTAYVMEDGVFKQVEEKKVIKALDEYDKDIEFEPDEPEAYLNKCVEVWRNYVKMAKS